MGTRDSSRTRVAPVFDRLFAIDPTGQSWLSDLLEIVGAAPSSGELTEACWWPTEKPLLPPLALLQWLAQNVQEPLNPGEWQKLSPATAEKRKRLIAREPEIVAEAVRKLQTERIPGAWHVLEGWSYPDVFLETEDLVVVIEGKRTESGPTTGSTWMRHRHQFVRHLDCAMEVLQGRRLVGIMIVEADEGTQVPPLWANYVEKLRSELLLNAIPHRSAQERYFIESSIAKPATWQAVCERLRIPIETLIPEIRVVESAAAKARAKARKFQS